MIHLICFNVRLLNFHAMEAQECLGKLQVPPEGGDGAEAVVADGDKFLLLARFQATIDTFGDTFELPLREMQIIVQSSFL